MPPNLVSEAVESPTRETAAELDEIEVKFSHVHLYVDHVEDVAVYKAFEDKLNLFHKDKSEGETVELARLRWRSIDPASYANQREEEFLFHSQNRDIVKQVLAGFGFRVTGYRFPSESVFTNTKTVLVTSRDPSGVQFVVSSVAEENTTDVTDAIFHFDARNIHRFYEAHGDRQGIAVLAFRVNSVDAVERKYRLVHPKLILHKQSYDEGTKVLEVFSYYQGDTSESDVDSGTVLRFVQVASEDQAKLGCILPGLTPVGASFDDTSQAAYCDHWVSNVISRTGFLKTLNDTLGFTPKVDFNAGVVAAGEAQIESTVTGNDAAFVTIDKKQALQDQSQVYLPINNALSEVGHVHSFLREIGQGIQHIASRVDNLIEFVQRANDSRSITEEGFTFLNIPRSYYGTLNRKDLIMGGIDSKEKGVSADCADAIVTACEKSDIVSAEGAVDLNLSAKEIDGLLLSNLEGSALDEFRAKHDAVLATVLRSRYINLYRLLRHHLSEKSYLGLVSNQILVDVQGDDLLFQIFTSNILQRNTGEEAPFLEFIQRVCSECKDETGCPLKVKPGCGGFGIRNFLTLFLSIEVSKSMMEAKMAQDDGRRTYAQEMVDCFTDQLHESNPILTEISDAMTEEGYCREQLGAAITEENKATWQAKMEVASHAKQVGNQKLMECSTKYKLRMRTIRERWSDALGHVSSHSLNGA